MMDSSLSLHSGTAGRESGTEMVHHTKDTVDCMTSEASEGGQTLVPVEDDSLAAAVGRAPADSCVNQAPAGNTVGTGTQEDPERESQSAHPHLGGDDDTPTCCICLEPYTQDNPMSSGTCRHHFHFPCLMEWKQRSNTCPMCCAETLYLPDPKTEAEAAEDRATSSSSPVDVSADAEMARLLHEQFKRQQHHERKVADERRKAFAAAQAARQANPSFTAQSSNSPKASPQLGPQRPTVPKSTQRPQPSATTRRAPETLPAVFSATRSNQQSTQNGGQCAVM